jgi:hypothetical protein
MSAEHSVVERILIEPPEWVETRRAERAGQGFYVKSLADGLDGGTRATLSVQPAGFVNPAHFHDSNQFQVVLEGSVEFPVHGLTAPAVHYSDSGTPYGPFVIGSGFKMAVLRTRKAKQIYMSDREGRKLRNPLGREIFGSAADIDWQPAPGQPAGTEHKDLFAAHAGNRPRADLFRCPAGARITGVAAPHGQYHVVLAGAIVLAQADGDEADGDLELAPYSMRYSAGSEAPRSFTAGEQGATVLVVAFDNSD